MKKILFLVLLTLSFQVTANDLVLLSPFPTGGPTDRILRVVSQQLKNKNINNVIEYKPGAGGVIAANYLARTQSNILMLPGLSLFTASHFKNAEVQYNIGNDFKLVHFVGIEPTVLVVKKTSNIEYTDILTKPLTAATPGLGTTSHIATLILKDKNKGTVVVPFKGENELISNILGGHVTWGIISQYGATQYIETGMLKPILTWTPERAISGVPTARELGVNDKNFFRAHILITNNYFDKRLLDEVKDVLKSTAFEKEIKNIGIHTTKVNEKEFLKLEQEKISAMFKDLTINE